MAVDVLNQLWVATCAASFVEQFAAEGRRQGSPGAGIDDADRFIEEAQAVADVALESYRRVCGLRATSDLGDLVVRLRENAIRADLSDERAATLLREAADALENKRPGEAQS